MPIENDLPAVFRPTVMMNYEGAVTEVSFFPARGGRLSRDQLARVAVPLLRSLLRLNLPQEPGRTACSFSPAGGWCLVRSEEAEHLHRHIVAVLTAAGPGGAA